MKFVAEMDLLDGRDDEDGKTMIYRCERDGDER